MDRSVVTLGLALLTTACGGIVATSAGDAATPADASNDGETAPEVAGDEGVDAFLGSDGDAGPVFDAPSDVAELQPCLGGSYVFYVDGVNYPGIVGPMSVTGADGTWSAQIFGGTDIVVFVTSAVTHWELNAMSGPSAPGGLMPGTYQITTARDGPQLGVLVDGGACPSPPTGTFTIGELAPLGADQGFATKLLLWFELTCNGQGSLRGCVAYGM